MRLIVKSASFSCAMAFVGCLPKKPIMAALKDANTPGAADGVVASWSQIGPDDTWLARAIVQNAPCPSLNIDGAPTAMAPRTAIERNFPAVLCEAAVPLAALSVTIEAQTLPSPKALPAHIVVVGDTGCRIMVKDEDEDPQELAKIQACNNNQDWPMPTVAAAIAAEKPDLVLHVGDYHYRESPCPRHDPGCAGAVSGDNWESWREDFFAPMAPVFAAAPLLLVRGNHELCARGGNGWFHYLDPRPMPAACTDKTDPYWVSVGDHRVAVIDAAADTNIQPSLDGLKLPEGVLVWLTLHRPFLTPGLDLEIVGPPAHLPPAMAGAGKIAAVVVGHKHLLRLAHFADARPPEIVAGNGATMLIPGPKGCSQAITGEATSSGLTYYDFGYMTLDRQKSGWALVAKDRNALPVVTCTMTEQIGVQTTMDCAPVVPTCAAPAATGSGTASGL